MQFGKALLRLLNLIHFADDRHGLVYLSKIDISDGFYRVDLEANSAPILSVILRKTKGEPLLVVVPLALPMGWVDSPLYFCAVTETIADLANARKHHRVGLHRLDVLADTLPPADDVVPETKTVTTALLPKPLPTPKKPTTSFTLKCQLADFDVYVDHFLAAVQGAATGRKQVRRVLMHTINDVLSPLQENDKSRSL